MKFEGATYRSDGLRGYMRSSCRYRTLKGDVITIEFVFEEHLADWLSDSSNAWFVLGVTSAFLLGEDYTHDQEVDALLARNMRALVSQWHAQFPSRPLIEITTAGTTIVPSAKEGGGLTTCLFTGGVDSSFTLAQRNEDIDVLASASFRFGNTGSYEFLPAARARYKQRTASTGKTAMLIGTNILAPFPEFKDAWSYLAHGPALAAMCHLFDRRMSSVIISSSHQFGELIPWGSHPLTDPLLTSSRLAVEHYGTTYTRYEKVSALAHHPELLKGLTVCGLPPDQKGSVVNCSKCQKCVRTMTALDLSCADRATCSSFDWSTFDARRIGEAQLYHANEFLFFEELADGARTAGRPEIALAAQNAIKRSAKFRSLATLEMKLRHRFPALTRSPWPARLKKKVLGALRSTPDAAPCRKPQV